MKGRPAKRAPKLSQYVTMLPESRYSFSRRAKLLGMSEEELRRDIAYGDGPTSRMTAAELREWFT